MSESEDIESYREDLAADVAADVRASIVRYLEHCASAELGMICLDGFSSREVMAFCASWVKNRLDVKWAAEVAANSPRSTSAQTPGDASRKEPGTP